MTEMDNKLTTPQEESTEIEALPTEPPPETEAFEAQPELLEAEPPPAEESKTRRGFRLALRWLLIFLIVFGVGYLVAIYTLYQPEVEGYKEKINVLQSELQTAQGQVTELEAQVADLSPLDAENQTLKAMHAEYELQVAILDARLDISNALLALAEEDIPRARIALERTGEALVAIDQSLQTEQKDVVAGMQQRLELVLTELDTDVYAAQSDLDVLDKRLLELEDALFGTP
jgi:polyhydroxyalkanoate synthesis regulator phasin